MTKKPTPTAIEVFGASELKKFEFTVDALQKKAAAYKDLAIKDLSDKEGLERVHAARMDIKNTRVAIEKTGKALRVSATAFNRSVLAREAELVGVIADTEFALDNWEALYDQWKEEERMAEERQEAARLDERMKKLRAVDADHDIVALKLMPDESFLDILEEATIAYNHRQTRKAEEQRVAQAERERVDREFKVEQARVKREQAELNAEADRQEKVRQEQENARKEIETMRLKLEQQQKAHEEKVLAEIEKQKRAVAQEQEKQRLAKEEKDRKAQKAAEAPDKEKAEALATNLAQYISHVMAPVTMKSAKYHAIHNQALEMLGDTYNLLAGKKE